MHGPLHPALLSNADYQASLQRLIDLDADVLCEGHYGIFKGRQEIVRSFMRWPALLRYPLAAALLVSSPNTACAIIADTRSAAAFTGSVARWA